MQVSLVGKAWLAEVYLVVDDTWYQVLSFSIDDIDIRRFRADA